MSSDSNIIRAVLFDFGETLFNFGRVDTAKIFKQSSRASYEYLRQNGQPVGGYFRYHVTSMLSLRLRYLLSRLRGRDFDSLELLKNAGRKRGLKLAEEQWSQLAWLWYEPLVQRGRPEPKLAETMSVLRDMKLKLGLVSNTFVPAETLDRHLRQLGVLDFLRIRLYSYQFAFRKPDPRIFRIAADRIGEKAANILFVGDRIETDARAALAAGMQAVLKTAYTNEREKTPGGIRKIGHLYELPDIIRYINGGVQSSAREQVHEKV
jgi:HAD superfamily hydrolase (TIGR01549 family)